MFLPILLLMVRGTLSPYFVSKRRRQVTNSSGNTHIIYFAPRASPKGSIRSQLGAPREVAASHALGKDDPQVRQVQGLNFRSGDAHGADQVQTANDVHLHVRIVGVCVLPPPKLPHQSRTDVAIEVRAPYDE